MFNSYRSRQNVSLCLRASAWELGENCFIHYYCLWCYESFLFVMFSFSFFLNPSRQFQLSFVEYYCRVCAGNIFEIILTERV